MGGHDRAWLAASLAVKWLMVEALFTGGVGIYAFYALQPFLLELYGDPDAYQIAGLVAAIVAGAQIVGGLFAAKIRKVFKKRTSALITTSAAATLILALVGIAQSFWLTIVAIVAWGLLAAASMPIRRTYLNGLIPSAQRASILSFDSMMESGGGVVIQPALGRAADVWSYGTSYVIGAAITGLAVPFLVLSRRQNARADVIEAGEEDAVLAPVE